MTNVGKWEPWYAGLSEPEPFGADDSYERAARWLVPCARVEDWGCGKGWFRRFLPEGTEYVGIDGSWSPFADVVTDLATYRSQTEGLLLRHVIEHDRRWRIILDNALMSFTRRMVLVVFTPLAEETTVIAEAEDIGVPDISFGRRELLEIVMPCLKEMEALRTATQYGTETVLLLGKP